MKPITRRRRAPDQSPSLEKSIGFLLRKAYQRNMVLFSEMSPHPDLTAVQAAALIVLNDHSPCSLAELGRMAAMDPATTRGVIDRMRKRQLLHTEPSEEDKREVIIYLDEEGRRIASTLRETGANISDATLASLNAAERIAVDFLLRKICGE